jgi:hypothetical protein
MANMLAIIQQASAEMSMPVPTFVAGNTQAQVVQFLALLNAVGYEVQRQHQWQALNKAYLFTVTQASITGNTVLGNSNLTNASSIAGIDTTYQISGPGINQATYVNSAPSGNTIPLSQPATANTTGGNYSLTKVKFAMPADYDRQINRTHWDKSRHWEMLGPESPQQWEWLISGYISTGPRVRYRIFGGLFQIWGIPANGEVLGFEYCSNGWAADASGNAKTSLTLDTDVCIFPDRLMVIGLKHKYWQLQGFADRFWDDYQAELSIAKVNDAGAPTLSMNPRVAQVLIGWENIPDSGYGS